MSKKCLSNVYNSIIEMKMCYCNRKCTFYDQSWYSNDFSTKNWFIIIIVSFLLASTLSLKEIVYGEDLKLPCKFPNTTKKVKWYKDDKPLKNSDHKRIINRKKGKVLKIKKVVQTDAGIYSCVDIDREKIIVQYNVSVKGREL